jgi:hypothetical protein
MDLTPLSSPRAADDPVDEEWLDAVGLMGGGGAVNAEGLMEVFALCRTHPGLLLAMKHRRGALAPLMRSLLLELGLLAETYACATNPAPPLSRGALASMWGHAAEPPGKRVSDCSWVMRVVSHGIDDDVPPSMHTHRVRVSDGRHAVNALLDTRLHATLCAGDATGAVWLVVDVSVVQGDLGKGLVIIEAEPLLGFQSVEVPPIDHDEPAPADVPDAPDGIDAPAVPPPEHECPGHQNGSGFQPVPRWACDGCDCDVAHGASGGRVEGWLSVPDFTTTYACNFQAADGGCRGRELPEIEEVYDKMCECCEDLDAPSTRPPQHPAQHPCSRSLAPCPPCASVVCRPTRSRDCVTLSPAQTLASPHTPYWDKPTRGLATCLHGYTLAWLHHGNSVVWQQCSMATV